MLIAACGDDDEDDGGNAATDAPASIRRSRGDRRGDGHRRRLPTTGGGESIRLWLNGGDTPDELVEYAIAEFNKIHPDVEVQFERQQWTGIVEKLTTALSSSDSPDVVEFGNTQAQTFEAAGAVSISPTSATSSAATTCCRACSRPARTTGSSTPCRTTPAPAS